MNEVKIDITLDIEDILEHIDIVLSDGWKLKCFNYLRQSKKLIAVFEK